MLAKKIRKDQRPDQLRARLKVPSLREDRRRESLYRMIDLSLRLPLLTFSKSKGDKK